MNNLLDLFYFAGDRVDYVVVHNPAKVRTNLFKKSNIEAELKKFGARELMLPVVTSISVAGHQTRRSQGGPQVEFRRSGDARIRALGIDAGRGNAMGDAADVPAIRPDC